MMAEFSGKKISIEWEYYDNIRYSLVLKILGEYDAFFIYGNVILLL